MSNAHWTLHKCYSSLLLSPYSFSLLHLEEDILSIEGEILSAFHYFFNYKTRFLHNYNVEAYLVSDRKMLFVNVPKVQSGLCNFLNFLITTSLSFIIVR